PPCVPRSLGVPGMDTSCGPSFRPTSRRSWTSVAGIRTSTSGATLTIDTASGLECAVPRRSLPRGPDQPCAVGRDRHASARVRAVPTTTAGPSHSYGGAGGLRPGSVHHCHPLADSAHVPRGRHHQPRRGAGPVGQARGHVSLSDHAWDPRGARTLLASAAAARGRLAKTHPETIMSDTSRDAEDVAAYYARGVERDRLAAGQGALELARTQALLERYLPPPPAVVADVGGGPGRYAVWLAERGYRVHL